LTAVTEVGRITEGESADAVGVLARGMRDNPLHVSAFGDDPDERVAYLIEMFTGVMPMQPEPLCASRGGTVVGVCGFGPPPECVFRTLGTLPMEQFPAMVSDRAAQARLGEWLQVWGGRDPEEPHFHLGPVAADADQQGQGVGTALMEAFCERVDRDHGMAYLETDKAKNVGFYSKFGFEKVGEQQVIGVPNWFMRREAR
jgi:GNAT superfamily N-acetyltransferase